LSSTFKNRNSFYNRMIEAFTASPDKILIMSAGKDSKAFKERGLAENIHVVDYAPQLNILKKTNIFITHGGAGSVRESIQFGVPMLVYPWQARSDMFGSGDRIVYHNLGMVGDMEQDTSNRIMARIDELLNNKGIKESMARMQAVFQAYDQQEDAVVDDILGVPCTARPATEAPRAVLKPL
jgi:UDP:flavonoid glycosyltransferase YjiC (YdhE family)